MNALGGGLVVLGVTLAVLHLQRLAALALAGPPFGHVGYRMQADHGMLEAEMPSCELCTDDVTTWEVEEVSISERRIELRCQRCGIPTTIPLNPAA